MDVRATDTSHIAAKRIEVEHGKPVKDKQGFMQDRLATHTAAEANGHVNRPRPPKDPRDGHEDHRHPVAPDESALAEDEQAVHPESPDGEQHILDVKV